MVATALMLNLQRNKSISTINNFVSNVTYNGEKRKRLMPKQSSAFSKMYIEIAQEVFESADIKEVLSSEQLNVSGIISSILKSDTKNCQISVFLKKCKKIELIILIAFFIGIAGSIISVLVRNVIDVYVFCFLVWGLSCISLWVTLKLIIKEWKEYQYGKKYKD